MVTPDNVPLENVQVAVAGMTIAAPANLAMQVPAYPEPGFVIDTLVTAPPFTGPKQVLGYRLSGPNRPLVIGMAAFASVRLPPPQVLLADTRPGCTSSVPVTAVLSGFLNVPVMETLDCPAADAASRTHKAVLIAIASRVFFACETVAMLWLVFP